MTSPLPHMVTSAVLFDAPGTHVLLVRTGEYPRWGLPGGHVEGGESLSESVRRQVREHGDVLPVRVVEPHVAVQQDLVDCGAGEVRHVDHVFAVVETGQRAADAAADAAADRDRAGRGWFPRTALPEPLAPGVQMLVRAGHRAAFGD